MVCSTSHHPERMSLLTDEGQTHSPAWIYIYIFNNTFFFWKTSIPKASKNICILVANVVTEEPSCLLRKYYVDSENTCLQRKTLFLRVSYMLSQDIIDKPSHQAWRLSNLTFIPCRNEPSMWSKAWIYKTRPTDVSSIWKFKSQHLPTAVTNNPQTATACQNQLYLILAPGWSRSSFFKCFSGMPLLPWRHRGPVSVLLFQSLSPQILSIQVVVGEKQESHGFQSVHAMPWGAAVNSQGCHKLFKTF